MKSSKGNFVGFIEELRKSKKLSREDFCSGIMSIRQYQRYVNGETDISNENLGKFADKLNANILLLHKAFQEKESKELEYLKDLLRLMNGMKHEEAYKKLDDHKNYVFSTNYYNNLYKYIETNIMTVLKKLRFEDSIKIFSELGNFNNINKSNSFTFVEIASLSYLGKLEAQRGKRETLDKLYEILAKKENIIFLGRYETEWMASVYSNLANTYGLIDDFDKVIELSNIGIKICKDNQLLNSLSYHFFNLALAYKLTNEIEQGLINARLALIAVKLEFNDSKFEAYKTSIEKNFDIDVNKLTFFQ